MKSVKTETWIVHERIKDSVVTSRGGPVADVVGSHDKDTRMNLARLIAAAPEMLHALMVAEDEIQASRGNEAVLEIVRNAITKAKGQYE